MVCTSRVEYGGHVFIVIGVNIVRILLRVYFIVPDSVTSIVPIVSIFIIFYRGVVLVSLVIVWSDTRDFMLQSIKDFQIYGGPMHKPPDQLEHASGEW